MNKVMIVFVLALMSASLAYAAPVKITADGEAYGHHGNCYGWNGCGDAATCALWACQINGFSTLVTYGDDRPCTQFQICHLFSHQQSIDCPWGNWCEVRGVTDIWCDDPIPGAGLACRADLPPQDNPPEDGNGNGEIPEFGIIAGIGLIGAAGYIIYRKRK